MQTFNQFDDSVAVNRVMSLRYELENRYQDFFKELDVDVNTGCVKSPLDIKFATYPYIGSGYGSSKKILIVGLDIGQDETQNIQSFDERQKIENSRPYELNPHFSGTYITALHFLKDSMNWHSYWENIKNCTSCKKALSNEQLLPVTNPLSYIALTNYYKFVSCGRTSRSGGQNRKHINEGIEFNLFIDEVGIFDPDIIIFQSTRFNHNKKLLDTLSAMGKPVFVGPHPSYRGKTEPEYFVSQIEPI